MRPYGARGARWTMVPVLLVVQASLAFAGAKAAKPDLEIKAKQPGPNNVFILGQPIRFPLTLKNNTQKPRTEKASLTLRDYFGKELALEEATVTLEAGAEAEIQFDFAPPATGHYTPVFKVAGQEKRELPIGVVPKPVEGARPLSVFGISGQFARSRREAEIMQLMGIKWARGDMAWPRFQGKRDQWRGDYDGPVQVARDLKMGLMATLGYTHNFAAQEFEWSKDFGRPPRWVHARHTAPVKPECLRDWEKYCARVVKDYGDVVKYWEIWNEADLNFYYGTPGEYMAMYKAAYCAIKKVDPDAAILGGNSCVCPYFIQRVVPDGFFAYTDVLAVHYPFSFDTPIEWNRSVTAYTKPYLEITGYWKPLEMTEGGNLIYRGRGEPFGITDASHKARILVKEHVLNYRQRQGKFYQFTFKKWSDPGWGFMPQSMQHPYTHFVSHAVMAHVLEDAQYVGRMDAGEDVSAYVFAKKMEPITVLWKGDYIIPAGECDIALDGGVPRVTRVDLMGGETVLKSGMVRGRGVFPLHLDQEPIYIVGGDRRSMARALAERTKPILKDLRRLAQKVDPADPVDFVEEVCRTAQTQSQLASNLEYDQIAKSVQSPLSNRGVEALLEATHTARQPIPAYNLLHKLCDLAEVLWLQAGVSGDRGKRGCTLECPSIAEADKRLEAVKKQIRAACGASSQPRVADMLVRAKQCLDVARHEIQLGGAKVNGYAAGQLAFADDLLSTALLLSRFERKLALNVYLSLNLPTSVHWGGRWEKKLLLKPLGQSLKFPAKATVHNRLPTGNAKGSLSLTAPEGWQVTPQKIEYDVAADQDKSYTFQVTVPPDNPFLPYESDLRLHGELGGDGLFPSTQQIEVVPPLWVSVRPSGTKLVEVRSADEVMDITGTKVEVVGDSGKIGQSDVTVTLRNRDKGPWAGTVKLELPPGWGCKPKEAKFEAIDHYRKGDVKFTIFYPSDVTLGPQYPILGRAYAADGNLIGMAVTGTGGQWKFKVGSDPKWAEKDFDDSEWEDRRTEYYKKPGYVGDVWFRQKMFLPASWGKSDLLLNLGVPCMAVEAFLNGNRVGQIGQWPPEWRDCWGDIGNLTVKGEYVEPGAWNTVAVRVLVPHSMGGITPGFIRPVR